jgi:hypothetical protein
MSIKTNVSNQITRISDAAELIKNKTVEMKLAKDKDSDGEGTVVLGDLIDIHARAFAKISSKGGETILPGTEDKTINSGQYLLGTQTVKSVSLDALAEKIVKGAVAKMNSNGTTISSVAGTAGLNYFTTGETEPNQSYGNDGDLYLIDDSTSTYNLAVDDNSSLVYQVNGEIQSDGFSLDSNDSLTSKKGFSLNENDSLILN